MSLGILALFVAAGAAGWLLLRILRGDQGDNQSGNVKLLKAVIWLGLVAALFAVKLWPLAFMVLLAAGAVIGIEIWRDAQIASAETSAPQAHTRSPQMRPDEAAEVLGISVDASAEDVRSAHRKLIAQIHPDKGGTDYLAGKINEARDLLLKQLEGR